MDLALHLPFIEPMGKPGDRGRTAVEEPKKRSRNYIREWRKYRDLTQEELGEAIGKSTGYISQLESGQKRWNQDVLEDIAGALRTTVTALLTRLPPPRGEDDPLAAWDRMDAKEKLRALTIYNAAIIASRH